MLAKLLILVLIIALVYVLFKGKKNKAEAVMANANGIGFLVCENISFARQLQAIANDYLFDSKIALIIKDDDELNDAIDARIDAVIYKSLIY